MEAEDYAKTAKYMLDSARNQEGFLGVESVRDEDVDGITISYWVDRTSIKTWPNNSEHGGQNKGKNVWYKDYRVSITKVEKEYGKI